MATIHTSIVLADNISNTLLNITSAMNTTLSVFDEIQATGADGFQFEGLDSARERIDTATQAVRQFEEQLQNIPNNVPVKIDPVWNIQSHLEVFQNTGIERLNSEMNSLNDLTQMVINSQRQIGEQALNMEILPPNASWDINATNERIEALNQQLIALQAIDIGLLDDASTERLNNEFEIMRSSMNGIVNLQEQMNTALENGDVSQLNAGYNQLNSIAEQVERRVRENMASIREMSNIQWTSPQTVEVFTNSGLERYRQEMQSANDMMNRVITTQNQISNTAQNTNILPPNAISDITGLNDRVVGLQQQLQRVEQHSLDDVGAEQASGQVEQLRQRLNNAMQAQNQLNDALQRMDVSGANEAYNRLNSVIDETDRDIRDNVNAQNDFNSRINQGTDAMGDLQRKIMAAAAAYLSIQGAKQVIGLSDTMAQTEARLNLIVDDGGSVEDLQNKIFLSAQESRSSYLAVSESVAKLGLMAGNAFSNNDEMIVFAEQLNKQFIIGGASVQEQTSAMYQLTQAMAAGKLQGDEFRSILENAPLLAQSIADSLGKSTGELKAMSSEGLITADVIKNALFMAADETNARFESMPKTFSQVGMEIQNTAMMAFQPVLNRLNEIANSPQFQVLVQNVIDAFVVVANVVMSIFDLIGAVGSFISDNWSIIAPIVLGAALALGIYTVAVNSAKIAEMAQAIWTGITTAAKIIAAGVTMALTGATAAQMAAQYGLNAALLACPLVWIIILIIAIIAIIYAVIAAVNKFAGTSISATGIIFGAFAWLGSVVANIFMGLLDVVFGVINAMINPFIRFANFIGNVFTNPISSIIYLFQGMADGVLGILQTIASALDFVFGSNMADAVAGWRSGIKEMADAAVAEYAPNENYQNVMNELDLSVEKTLGWERFDNTDAFNAGYKAGENLETSISNFDMASLFGGSNIPDPNDYANTYDPSAMAGNVGNIADNTGDMKDTMNATEEDLKYMRDIAERDVINRFTTAEVSVSFGGVTNNVNSNMDLDGIVDYIAENTREVIEAVAEGVH